MKSKNKEYRAAYWRKYMESRRLYVSRVCGKCGNAFSPRGRQVVCRSCSVTECQTCRVLVPRIRGKDRRFCSRACAAKQPHVIARLNKNRGVKPRTYLKNNRLKHGCAEDREWRLAVFARDGFTCQLCGQIGGRLQADHIKSFAAYPELRHAIDNGRTLCVSCHRKTPNYGSRARTEIAARRMGQEVLAL